MILKLLDFFDFFGFWGVVWKFWREALGLSWEFSVGCKDSSGLVGFDYDGLHFSRPLPPPPSMGGDMEKCVLFFFCLGRAFFPDFFYLFGFWGVV